MGFEKGDRVRHAADPARRGVVAVVDRNDRGEPVYGIRWDGSYPKEYGYHTSELESDS